MNGLSPGHLRWTHQLPDQWAGFLRRLFFYHECLVYFSLSFCIYFIHLWGGNNIKLIEKETKTKTYFPEIEADRSSRVFNKYIVVFVATGFSDIFGEDVVDEDEDDPEIKNDSIYLMDIQVNLKSDSIFLLFRVITCTFWSVRKESFEKEKIDLVTGNFNGFCLQRSNQRATEYVLAMHTALSSCSTTTWTRVAAAHAIEAVAKGKPAKKI